MKATNFLEIMDEKGDLIWGGENPHECVDFYRRFPNASVFVSVWDTESKVDFKLLQDRVEITSVIDAALINEYERSSK